MTRSRPLGALAALIVLSLPCAALAAIPFTEVSASAGVRTTHDPLGYYDDAGNPFQNGVGSGAAWTDYNGDGWLDLFVTNGTTPGNFFYLNNGDGSFTDVSEAMRARTGSSGNGVVCADINNDGYPDVFIANHLAEPDLLTGTTYGQANKSLAYGMNNFHYRAGHEPLGYTGPLSMGVALGDYDRDGYLDAYVANFLFSSDVLARNLGGGAFRNSGLIVEPVHGYGCTPVFFDYDTDGDLDIFVVNDLMRDFLFRNDGAAGFTEVAYAVRIAGGNSTREALSMGMGCALGDFDNDLDLDVYVTNFRANALWENPGSWGAETRTVFRNIAPEKKLDFALNSWGTEFFDADNDGDLDLFMVGGWVHGGPDIQPHEIPNRFWENSGAPNYTFTETSDDSGLRDVQYGRSQAVGDYDRDGDLDIFVTNISFYDPAPDGYTPPTPGHTLLYRNESNNANNWISLRLQGAGSHENGLGCSRDAVNAKVYLHSGGSTQMRMVQAGSGFMGSNSLEVEFGLGTQSVIDDIEVHWLCGNISHFENLAPNRFYRLLEEGNTVVYAPVIFESFSVLMNSNSASVTWRSDANIDVSQVVFQRAPLDETLRFENISLDYSLESGVGSAVDTEVQEGESYGYRMMLVDAQGNRAVSPTVTATAGNSYRTPTRAVLGQNFPNPFNPSTTILFTLTARTHVRLTIFDERGRAVRKLYEATLDAGRDYPVNWDGNDDNEAPVASGVYYYALSTDQGTQTRKLALVR